MLEQNVELLIDMQKGVCVCVPHANQTRGSDLEDSSKPEQKYDPTAGLNELGWWWFIKA